MEILGKEKLSIRGRLSFLLKDSLIYGSVAATSKAASLVTFPLLAQHFSVAEYGALDYLFVISNFMTILCIFGQDSAVARYFYEHEEISDRRQIISQSLVFQLMSVSLLLPIFWLGANALVVASIKAPHVSSLFKVILIQLPFMVLINFSQNLLKWTFSRARFLTISLGFTISQAALTIVAVLIFDAGLRGILFIGAITNAFFGLLGLFFVRQWLSRPNGFSRLKEMLPYAWPYGLICVAAAFSPMVQRTLVGTLIGPEELGLYAVATKIAMLMGLLVGAFQTAWGPFSLSLYKQVGADEIFNWVFKLFALVTCTAVLALTLLARPLVHFLATDRYSGAEAVVFPLAMGLAVQATGWITEIGIAISKRSYLNIYSHFSALAFTLIGTWLFTANFGLLGIGLGVLSGYSVKSLLSSWLAQYVYPLSWHYRPVAVLMIITMILGMVAIWFAKICGGMFGSLVLLTSMLLVILGGWFLLFEKLDRERLLALAKNRLVSYYARK